MANSNYSLPIDAVVDLAEESEKLLSVSRDLLIDNLQDHDKDYKNMLLCESFSLNKKLLKQIEHVVIHSGDQADKKEEGNDHINISQENMFMVETILLARHWVVKELSSLGLSIEVH